MSWGTEFIPEALWDSSGSQGVRAFPEVLRSDSCLIPMDRTRTCVKYTEYSGTAPPHRGRAGGEPKPKMMPRGAGLSFASGAGGTAPLYPKTRHFKESQPQNCCVLITGGVGGEWEGQEGAPAKGVEAEGVQEGRSEGKGGMEGKEGRGHGRKVKGTPKEERDAAH